MGEHAGVFSRRQASEIRHSDFDNEATAGLEMGGRIGVTGHLLILSGQISDRIEYEVYQPKGLPDVGCCDVPDGHLDPTSAILGAQPADHGGGEVNARYGHAAVCERQSHATRAYGELKS